MLYYRQVIFVNKKRGKRKLKVGRIVLAILILIIIIVGIILIVKKTNVITLKMTEYLASDISTVTLYTYD